MCKFNRTNANLTRQCKYNITKTNLKGKVQLYKNVQI